jgi:hypothetical protein
VAEPVIAEEETACLRPKGNRRNDWLRVPWAPEATRHRYAPSRAPQRTRITGPAEHVTSRNGGRAVHGIVPPAFEFRGAQCRVGLPREWRDGTARHSHQEGRRDARRWPRSTEDHERHTPPQGGEPERRRDKRRTRRQAGDAEKRTQGRCCRARSSETRVAEPGAAEKVARHVGPRSDRRAPGTAATGPGRIAPPIRPFSCSAEHGNHVPRGAREGTQRWDVPLLENVLLTPRSCVGTFSRVAILGERASEKRATATKKAVETPEGGRNRPRNTGASRHRRAASRSGGATSAERDGRPVTRRIWYTESVRSVAEIGVRGRWPGTVTVTGNRGRIGLRRCRCR